MKLYTDKQIIYLSYILTLIALIIILPLKLFTCFFAGFLIYEIVVLITPLIEKIVTGKSARIITTFFVAILLVLVLSLLISGLIIFLINSFEDISALQKQVGQIITDIHDSFKPWLPFAISEVELQQQILSWLKDNIATVQNFGKDIAGVFINAIIGLIIGLFISIHKLLPSGPEALLKQQLFMRVSNLAVSFSSVVFAQVKISAINTFLTAIFLLVLMPIFHTNIPLAKTLVILTFIFGLLPVIGNLISNSIIFVAGFSVSPLVAVSILLFLIVIHKLEYFLNARIIGGHIKASAWEILIAMFLLHAMFGIAGIIAAPIYYAYIKLELRLLGLI